MGACGNANNERVGKPLEGALLEFEPSRLDPWYLNRFADRDVEQEFSARASAFDAAAFADRAWGDGLASDEADFRKPSL
jgi:hypothetical protein